MADKRKKAAKAAKLAKDKMACNKPKKTPSHPTKSHVVKACKDGKEKIVRFGQLYKVFSNAGYKGTEDEFYEKFFPDTSRSEQILLTKGGSGTGLEMVDIDYSDPFAAFGSVQGLLGDEEEERQESDEEDRKSFFSLNLDDDDDEDYKSKRGQEILGEFTSIFKGF